MLSIIDSLNDQELAGDLGFLEPNALLTLRRGMELSRKYKNATLTLLTVQPTSPDNSSDPASEGENIIRSAAYSNRLSEDSCTSKVIISDNVREALLQAVQEFDTIV